MSHASPLYSAEFRKVMDFRVWFSSEFRSAFFRFYQSPRHQFASGRRPSMVRPVYVHQQ
ncbi:hypothetical protein KCP73_07420 [Salmonella enterica subsp. enterica]|nr:hypothetical protein KCP73_07420 [Salmonella enterica subsp. enterica]